MLEPPDCREAEEVGVGIVVMVPVIVSEASDADDADASDANEDTEAADEAIEAATESGNAVSVKITTSLSS